MTLTYEDRLARLDSMIAGGLLSRKGWGGMRDGRETACLLGALSPEAGASHAAGACPADVMPEWLAGLTPWINDFGSVRAWPAMTGRYAALAHRWPVLTPEDWERSRALCVGIVRLATTGKTIKQVGCHLSEGWPGKALQCVTEEFRERGVAPSAAQRVADGITTSLLDALELVIAERETTP